MSIERQRKKLFDGMRPKEARLKLADVWAKTNPGVDIAHASREFAKAHKISLFALAETWHKFRSQNFNVDAMIQAFAERVSILNKQNRTLQFRITSQRKRLAALEKIVADSKRPR
jgi:hypothetical protein